MDKSKIRNIAVIAHIDHGKTTLVDGLLKQAKVFRENEAEMNQTTILDRNDLEKERGITIFSKIASVNWKDYKINIIDTPGHADFGGEVERVLNMADGALLIVDAQEGPMPQTKFVLKKAFDQNLKIIVVINKIDKSILRHQEDGLKIDKKDARINEVEKLIENLFLELAQNHAHLDYPVIYAIGRKAKAWKEIPTDVNENADLTVLFDEIISSIPPAKGDENDEFGLVITDLDFDSFNGKYVIGKIVQGKILKGAKVNAFNPTGEKSKFTVTKLFNFEGLGKKEIESAGVGEIVAICGLKNGSIGDVITTLDSPPVLSLIKIEEPTLKITLGVNTSPFVGREGKYSTSRQIGERLAKEVETNLALKVEELPSGNEFLIFGRGELHLSILMENLRREGFEFQVGKPEVIIKEENGKKLEPFEEVTIDVPTVYQGAVSGEISKRRGVLADMVQNESNLTRLTFKLSTRGSLGLRNALLTLTRGTSSVNSMFDSWQTLGDQLPKLRSGVLIASQTGKAVTYGLNIAQGRGITFIEPGTEVYQGMIIGQTPKDEDIEINVTKEKKQTNVRASTSDISVILTPAKNLSLEESLNFLESDELLEVTPQTLRLRKKYLTMSERYKAKKNA
ncbi:MAG TPA: GTP-binding protein [Patescibacteria group bacterium]